jgi:hypothetical protein
MSRVNLLACVVLIVVGLGLVLPRSTGAQDVNDGRRPAWPDVFIKMGMYSLRYEKPVVDKGDKPEIYQQKVSYSWSGGRSEVLFVTLARDPAFKGRFSADTLKKEKNPPKELAIDEKKAWYWTFDPKDRRLDVAQRLVVLLDVDKAIIIERIGSGPSLENVAKRFDFAKVAKALANPPAK